MLMMVDKIIHHVVLTLTPIILEFARGDEVSTSDCTSDVCFPESYNKFEPPEERLPIYIGLPSDLGPVLLTEVNDFKFTLTLHGAITMCWQDRRVVFNNNASYFRIRDKHSIEKFWKSGLYVHNLNSNKNILQDVQGTVLSK